MIEHREWSNNFWATITGITGTKRNRICTFLRDTFVSGKFAI